MPAHYDVVVLGSGPGGYTAAARAARLGLSAAVVEERFWGGVCLNTGCVPSKALLYNAELADLVTRQADTFGIRPRGGVCFDYGTAFARSRQVAGECARRVRDLMRDSGVVRYDGRGTFLGPNTLRVAQAGGGTETVTFGHCVIATGATARLLPGAAASERVVTYEEQILSSRLPESIVIAGAGAIGVEFAYLLHQFGVKVTVVEFLDRIVALEDEEVSAELARQVRMMGIEVRTGTRVESIADTGTQVRVSVSCDGRQETLTAGKVLQAVGFQPRVRGFGLRRTGVTLTASGAIAVDGRGRTSVAHLFAVGDVTAQLMLAHAAEAMGIVAAETIAGADTREPDFVMMPKATYCRPQIANFGLTETQARAAGHDLRVAKSPFTASARAHGLADARGFVKIVSEGRSGRLLGAHMIGAGVSELLPELTLAQQRGLTVGDIARNVHAHPTLGEAVKEAALGLTGPMTGS